MAGLVVLLLGIQLRLVEAFVLNERATQFVAQRLQQVKAQTTGSSGTTLVSAEVPVGTRRIQRPRWLSYSLMSLGGVLVLYSLALKKPGG